MTGIVDLTPSQAIRIYGYWSPLRLLDWRVISDREDLTFKKLYSLGLTEKQLYRVQSNKDKWIRDKGLTLEDLKFVPSWRVNPIRDMHATILQIAMLNPSAEFLINSGVTFQDLVNVGLTLNLMAVLRMSLMDWIRLGLHQDFLRDCNDTQSIALFQLPKHLVLQCVHEKGHHESEIDEAE